MKNDLDRLGIFKDCGYTTIGDPYVQSKLTFNASASKGKQFIVPCSKTRCAQSDGYFDNKFKRVFEGEAYTDAIKMRRKFKKEALKKQVGKPFIDSGGCKQLASNGSYLGTFGGRVPYFSLLIRENKATPSTKKNFLTNNLKQGTGYGYADVCLNPYPKYSNEKYEQHKTTKMKELEAHKKLIKGSDFKVETRSHPYFESNPFASNLQGPLYKEKKYQREDKIFKYSSPAKKDGGMKAGTFSLFPIHMPNPVKAPAEKKPKVVDKVFIPNPGPKSMRITSVMNQNINKTITPINYLKPNNIFTL